MILLCIAIIAAATNVTSNVAPNVAINVKRVTETATEIAMCARQCGVLYWYWIKIISEYVYQRTEFQKKKESIMYIMQTPAKYLQGPNLIDDIGKFVKDYGRKFLILSGKTALKHKKDSIEKSIDKYGLECTFVPFGGESTISEINRVIEILKEGRYDGVIGMGGGKATDTAKSAAYKMGLKTIIVPTMASSDAPCSCESMIYSNDGVVEDCEVFPRNPDLVLVDSDFISKSPVNSFIAGMGDAAATFFETRVCYENHFANVHGMEVPEAAMGLSGLCYELLLEYGYDAKCSVEKQTVTDALEKVIEANIYLSGVGFENGGLSCAHSIHDALTMLPECHKYMHGHKVAFGSLCQLLIEGRPDSEVDQYLGFSKSVGLPLCFEQIGIRQWTEEKIRKIAGAAFIEDPEHECKMPPAASKERIYEAMIMADTIGHSYLDGDKLWND